MPARAPRVGPVAPRSRVRWPRAGGAVGRSRARARAAPISSAALAAPMSCLSCSSRLRSASISRVSAATSSRCRAAAACSCSSRWRSSLRRCSISADSSTRRCSRSASVARCAHPLRRLRAPRVRWLPQTLAARSRMRVGSAQARARHVVGLGQCALEALQPGRAVSRLRLASRAAVPVARAARAARDAARRASCRAARVGGAARRRRSLLWLGESPAAVPPEAFSVSINASRSLSSRRSAVKRSWYSLICASMSRPSRARN